MWPWGNREKRQTASYTDAVIGFLQRQAGGQAGELGEVAALEIAAGLYGRAFASAAVKGAPDAVADAVTPGVLELIGRELIRKGEAAFEIVLEGGALRLQPAASWTVYGSPSPASWRYELTAAGPDRTHTTRFLTGARVVHARYACSPSEPWRGQSPMRVAAATSRLMSNVEDRLADELSAQTGILLPIPEDATQESKDALKADIAGLKGKVALAPTTRGGWGGGQETRPAHDWQAMRIGANPPEVLDTLRSSAARHVLAACGVPPEVLEPGQGTAAREAYRRFLHSSVAPVAALVVAELRDKLDAPGLELSFDKLFASDLSGRARAFQSMVGGGMDVSKAAALAGLMEPED